MSAAPLVDSRAGELPQVEPPPSVSVLRLIRAFRSDLLGAFSVNFYTDLRVSFRRLGHRFVCLNDPNDIDHVLNTHMHRYQPNVLSRRLLELIVGNGLLFAEDDRWRRQHGQLALFSSPGVSNGSSHRFTRRPRAASPHGPWGANLSATCSRTFAG